jgi:hypothetical protein
LCDILFVWSAKSQFRDFGKRRDSPPIHSSELAFLLSFAFGCRDKEVMAELKEFKGQAALEEAKLRATMFPDESIKSLPAAWP